MVFKPHVLTDVTDAQLTLERLTEKDSVEKLVSNEGSNELQNVAPAVFWAI